MKRQSSVGRSLVLLAVIGLGASMTTLPAAAEEKKTPQVKWGQCPEDVVAEAAPTVLQCTTMPVPLDYAHPEGEQIDLTVSRLAVTDPDKRRGVLMLNPGGPGGSGLALSALLVAQGLPSSVTDRYDLIGMDTRGIGHSTPVSCGFTTDSPYYSNIPPYAVDDAAVTAQAKVAEQAAKQCADNDDNGRLRHLTTANTARDLDRIRAALGEEKTSYLGYSYGTALGAAYASMFPDRSDRMVLDSNVGDTHLNRDGMRRYALGMEQTLPDFAKWAAGRHDSYGLGRTPSQVRASYLAIAGRLDKAPVAGIDGGLFRLLDIRPPVQADAVPPAGADLADAARRRRGCGPRSAATAAGRSGRAGITDRQRPDRVPRRHLQRRRVAQGRQHLPAGRRQGP